MRAHAAAAAGLGLALLAGAGRAQDATAWVGAGQQGPATSLESYLVQPGRLLVERRYPLPAIALDGGARLVLEAIVAYEPAREQERVLGVRARLLGGPEARTLHLDLHEVEDLARTLAALPAILAQEQPREAPVEIRYVTRDGFGVALATGGATARRVLRFGGAPPREMPISAAALEELRVQLDASRRYLFEE